MKMDQPRLTSLPMELVHYMSGFLSKKDIMRLSETCFDIYDVMNNDRVWERFVTKQMKQVGRILEFQQQLVCQPPIDLKPDVCKAKQYLIYVNRLLSNWKTGKSVAKTSCIHDIKKVEDVLFFKEDFMLTKEATKIHFWDIRDTPVLHSTTFIPNTEKLFVIEDNLVLVLKNRCIVDVRKINTEEKSLLHCFSFSVTENEVSYGKVPSMVCEHQEHRSESFDSIKVNNLLVFVPRANKSPSVIIWDIINAKRIGEYASPMWGPTMIHSCQDNKLVFQSTNTNHRQFFKWDILTREFSKQVEQLPNDSTKVLFYDDHCIQFCPERRRVASTLVCKIKIDDPISSFQWKRKHFNDVHSSFLENLPIVVCLGKFVVPSVNSVHVVSASSLETEATVLMTSCSAVFPISLSGSIFFETVESEKYVRVWDLENRSPVLMLQPEEFSFNESCGFTVYGGDCCNTSHQVKIEDENSHNLRSKLITFGGKKVTVTHLW